MADPLITVIVGEADFDLGDLVDQVRTRHGGAGAIASFVGAVRVEASDSPVTELWLEHYPGMTERSIETFVQHAWVRWPLLEVIVVHRVGKLPPGAQIVAVVVASRHRAAAFEACQFVMDYLKTDAIFWKRERLRDGGERWVEATGDDRTRVARWQSEAR